MKVRASFVVTREAHWTSTSAKPYTCIVPIGTVLAAKSETVTTGRSAGIGAGGGGIEPGRSDVAATAVFMVGTLFTTMSATAGIVLALTGAPFLAMAGPTAPTNVAANVGAEPTCIAF